MPALDPDEARRAVIQDIIKLIQLLLLSLIDIVFSPPPKSRKAHTPYHTSILSGHQWVKELLNGHPECIHCELGLHKDVFLTLLEELREMGHRDSKHVTLEEQVAITLYISVTGLTVRHVGERFQRSSDTIARYFKKMVNIFSSPPFYTKYINFPSGEGVPSKIRHNPKFFPYFRDAIGAINGSHIPITPPSHLHSGFRNRKGFLSQNGLFICDFNFDFTYILLGWEGSATDARIYDDAISNDLNIAPGKYLLADAGYPLRPQLLVPYCGVRYHLAEWGRANVRPANKEELFNLRHASAHNIIERIFGVLKRRFRILLLLTAFSMDIQVKIPAALCVIHNFIRFHTGSTDDDESSESGQDDCEEDDFVLYMFNSGQEGMGIHVMDDATAKQRRDAIAQAMWDDYQDILLQRGNDDEFETDVD